MNQINHTMNIPTVYSRLAKLEYGAAVFEQKIGAASELAADAALWAKEARAIAASSQRQSSKVPYHPKACKINHEPIIQDQSKPPIRLVYT